MDKYIPFKEAIETTKETDQESGLENSTLDIETTAFFAKLGISVDELVLVDENQDDLELFEKLDEIDFEKPDEVVDSQAYTKIECYTKPFPIVCLSDYGYHGYILPQVEADKF